jgi:hypothetical protein
MRALFPKLCSSNYLAQWKYTSWIDITIADIGNFPLCSNCSRSSLFVTIFAEPFILRHSLKPADSPLGDASNNPLLPAVEIMTNGESEINFSLCVSKLFFCFLTTSSIGELYKFLNCSLLVISSYSMIYSISLRQNATLKR